MIDILLSRVIGFDLYFLSKYLYGSWILDKVFTEVGVMVLWTLSVSLKPPTSDFINFEFKKSFRNFKNCRLIQKDFNPELKWAAFTFNMSITHSISRLMILWLTVIPFRSLLLCYLTLASCCLFYLSVCLKSYQIENRLGVIFLEEQEKEPKRKNIVFYCSKWFLISK